MPNPPATAQKGIGAKAQAAQQKLLNRSTEISVLDRKAIGDAARDAVRDLYKGKHEKQYTERTPTGRRSKPGERSVDVTTNRVQQANEVKAIQLSKYSDKKGNLDVKKVEEKVRKDLVQVMKRRAELEAARKKPVPKGHIRMPARESIVYVPWGGHKVRGVKQAEELRTIVRRTLAQSNTGVKGGVVKSFASRTHHAGPPRGTVIAMVGAEIVEGLIPESRREASDRQKLESVSPQVQKEVEGRQKEIASLAEQNPTATVWANVTVTVVHGPLSFGEALGSQAGGPSPSPPGPIESVTLESVALSYQKVTSDEQQPFAKTRRVTYSIPVGGVDPWAREKRAARDVLNASRPVAVGERIGRAFETSRQRDARRALNQRLSGPSAVTPEDKPAHGVTRSWEGVFERVERGAAFAAHADVLHNQEGLLKARLLDVQQKLTDVRYPELYERFWADYNAWAGEVAHVLGQFTAEDRNQYADLYADVSRLATWTPGPRELPRP